MPKGRIGQNLQKLVWAKTQALGVHGIIEMQMGDSVDLNGHTTHTWEAVGGHVLGRAVDRGQRGASVRDPPGMLEWEAAA